MEALRTSLSEDQQDMEMVPEMNQHPAAASIYPDELMGSVDIAIKDDEAIYGRSRHRKRMARTNTR